MLPEDAPFPCHWWGTSLDNVGLGDVRPDGGTYGRYSFKQLPPLPFEMNGSFQWLASEPEQAEHHIESGMAENNAKAMVLLRQSLQPLGLGLPDAFVRFMETLSLQHRIRSNTDCFLQLSEAPIRSPIGEGYLIMFLSDSQGCVYWYLYVTKDGADHCVVSTPDFYVAEGEQDDTVDPERIVFVAESFEAFMCRFWLENEIWYAEYKKTPMPRVGQQYIEQYRSKK